MLTFTMTTEQAQVMLNALTQLPYVVVHELIDSIQQQAAEQMAAKPE